MDLLEAYERARTDGVAITRPDAGLVRLSGPQRVWFLQNTITSDVESVPCGRVVESCFLNPKGKVLAHFRVGVGGEELWIDVDPPATSDLVDWFVRYRFRTQVQIEDVSAGAVTVVGPAARRFADDAEMRLTNGAVAFGWTLSAAAGPDGWTFPDPIAVTEVHGGAADDLPRAAPDLWDVLRIERGVGRFGVDYGRDTLPQEAGLTRIVSVDKGCYVGQEVVARLHFRGHVNRVLRPLQLRSVADGVGRSLLEGETKVGVVTSAVRSPALGDIGIGMVRVSVETGTVTNVEGGGTAAVGPVPGATKTSSDERRPPKIHR